METKSETKSKKLQAKATTEGDVVDTTATRDGDHKYLINLTAACWQKTTDFESRQQLRAEELGAVPKAIEIVSSGAVAGSADKYLPSWLRTESSSSLAQFMYASVRRS